MMQGSETIVSYFPTIEKIKFEGRESKNPLAFKWYDASRLVAGKTMQDHLKFACSYWHSFCGSGADPFGEPTHLFPWDKNSNPVQRAKDKADAAFEFLSKIGLKYYCFHDTDVVEHGSSVEENEARMTELTAYLKKKQEKYDIQLLWGTANLFSNRRYMNGASTNPNFEVLAHGAAQVKAAIDATIALGGTGYTFWGGREGYMTLLNTDMKREKEHFAQFLRTAIKYARGKGFTGSFYIEPKPCEPSKHQYDYDAETVIGFLRAHDLLGDVKLNLEVNHATLAGHTFQHELQVAVDNGLLGSIDANRGDYQNGWDTDQFPNNVTELTEAMLVILDGDGINPGGINFDAKIRRNSTDVEDLFYAHIGGMDCFARALLVATEILEKSEYKDLRQNRYKSFDSGDGARFEKGELGLEELRNIAVSSGEPTMISGRQEYFENIINDYL